MARAKRFSVSITNFVKKTGLSADLVLKRLGFEVFYEWAKQAPVDTGFFRGNTRITVNSSEMTPDERTAAAKNILGVEKGPPTGAPVKGSPPSALEQARANLALQAARFGDVIHITNNTIYARPLNKGHSKQAPDGIIDPVFSRVKSNFQKVVRSVRSAKVT